MTNLIYMLRSKAPTYYCDKENDKASILWETATVYRLRDIE